MDVKKRLFSAKFKVLFHQFKKMHSDFIIPEKQNKN